MRSEDSRAIPAAKPPVSIAPDGLTFGGLAETISWADVQGVELFGPTLDKPKAPMTVLWSFTNRPPITIEAKAMAQQPEIAILSTLGFLPKRG